MGTISVLLGATVFLLFSVLIQANSRFRRQDPFLQTTAEGVAYTVVANEGLDLSTSNPPGSGSAATTSGYHNTLVQTAVYQSINSSSVDVFAGAQEVTVSLTDSATGYSEITSDNEAQIFAANLGATSVQEVGRQQLLGVVNQTTIQGSDLLAVNASQGATAISNGIIPSSTSADLQITAITTAAIDLPSYELAAGSVLVDLAGSADAYAGTSSTVFTEDSVETLGTGQFIQSQIVG